MWALHPIVSTNNLIGKFVDQEHDPKETGMTSEEAVEMFKLINNAQEYLRGNIRN